MKKALLVVSFGTSYPKTREKTINQCEKKIEQAFEGYDFFRAYTSTVIIKKLAQRDQIYIDTPFEALQKIESLGYKEVVIQSLHIICGDEYDKLKAQVGSFENRFERLTIGRPLLTTVEDYEAAAQASLKALPLLEEGEAIIFMGHGTTRPYFRAYCTLEQAYRRRVINVYMGAVKGDPTFGNVLKQLEQNDIKTVYLLPFMLVAGNHAEKDMASDEENSWKKRLENQGIEVKKMLRGLGENPSIQDLFVQHAKESMGV